MRSGSCARTFLGTVAKKVQDRVQLVTSNRLQDPAAAKQRAEPRRERRDQNAGDYNVRCFERSILKQVQIIQEHQSVKRARKRDDQRQVRNKRSENSPQRSGWDRLFGVLLVARQVSTFHDAGGHWKNDGEQ